MGDIVNLRRRRKQILRDEAVALAMANNIKFGRTKPERQATRIEATRLETYLDGHDLTHERKLDEQP